MFPKHIPGVGIMFVEAPVRCEWCVDPQPTTGGGRWTDTEPLMRVILSTGEVYAGTRGGDLLLSYQADVSPDGGRPFPTPPYSDSNPYWNRSAAYWHDAPWPRAWPEDAPAPIAGDQLSLTVPATNPARVGVPISFGEADVVALHLANAGAVPFSACRLRYRVRGQPYPKPFASTPDEFADPTILGSAFGDGSIADPTSLGPGRSCFLIFPRRLDAEGFDVELAGKGGAGVADLRWFGL